MATETARSYDYDEWPDRLCVVVDELRRIVLILQHTVPSPSPSLAASRIHLQTLPLFDILYSIHHRRIGTIDHHRRIGNIDHHCQWYNNKILSLLYYTTNIALKVKTNYILTESYLYHDQRSCCGYCTTVLLVLLLLLLL